jgi:hypothetical protein
MEIRFTSLNSNDFNLGQIEFELDNVVIFTLGGNIKKLLLWLLINKHNICTDLFFYGNEIKSLAKRMYDARNLEFNTNQGELNIVSDYWHEKIYEYYECHGLTFGLRGFNNLDVIIGKNSGKGEFSCVKEGIELFCYSFDLEEFYAEVGRMHLL